MELIGAQIQTSTNLRPAPGVDNSPLKSYQAGMVAYGDEIFTIPANVFKGTLQIAAMGDEWLKVTRIDGINVTGYMALRHLGKTTNYPVILFDNRNNPTDPDPDPDPVEDEIISATLRYKSGKVVELVK